MTNHCPTCVFAVLIAAVAVWGPRAAAQDVNYVLSGYGTIGYEAQSTDSLRHDFSASFTPVALFKMGENVLFESETEFELHDGSTTTTLEHAQVHYLGWNRVQLTAGKFHLPFGIWKHPDWINKMPSPPLLYGHADNGVAQGVLLPILFDVGVKAMGKLPVGRSWALGGTVWVSQGPSLASEESGGGHAHGGGHAGDEENHHGAVEVASIAYGVNYSDNNANKMVGGRLRLMNGRNVMVGVAAFHAAYDPEARLGVTGANLSIKWQPGSFDLRAEGALLRQEFRHESEADEVWRGGYYLQVARRMRAYEPIVRWSHLPASHVEGSRVQAQRRQLAVGLNYWITPSIPVKAAYQWEVDGPDGLQVQWAFGF